MNLNTPKPSQQVNSQDLKGDGLDLNSRAWRDMIFADKNKEFGAYQLRAKSDRRHNNATLYTIIGLIVVALGIYSYSLYSDYRLEQERIAREEAEKMMEARLQQEAEQEETPEEEPEQKYEEPKVEVKEEVLATVQVTQIAIVDKDKVKNEVMDMQEQKEDNTARGVVNQEGGTDVDHLKAVEEQVKVVQEPEKPVVKEEPQKVFRAVEQMPQFPGGQAALMSWLSKNIRYPQMALQNDISGKVVVEFVVEKDGSVGSTKIIRGVDKDLDREALRVVKAMPKWQPGKNNGQAVRCYYTLPVTFKIQQQ